MKEITVKAYQFNELEKKIQEKVLEKYRFINVEYFPWYDYTYEEIEKILSYFGEFKKEDIEFDIDRNRIAIEGEFKYTSFQEISEYPEFQELLTEYVCMQKRWNNDIEVYIRNDRNGYSYISDIISSIEKISGEKMDDISYSNIEKEFKEFTKKLYSKFFKLLYQEYEYLTSNEAIEEFFEINDFWFLENGTIFNQ